MDFRLRSSSKAKTMQKKKKYTGFVYQSPLLGYVFIVSTTVKEKHTHPTFQSASCKPFLAYIIPRTPTPQVRVTLWFFPSCTCRPSRWVIWMNGQETARVMPKCCFVIQQSSVLIPRTFDPRMHHTTVHTLALR